MWRNDEGIYGVGVDAIEIARVARAVERNARFLERYFTQKERTMFMHRGARGNAGAAMNFAGKEAVAKALQTGISEQVRLEQIEILRGMAGEPEVHLYGETLAYARQCGITRIHISLSDTKDLAVAFAVAQCADSKRRDEQDDL